MTKIVLDMQSALYARLLERTLLQEFDDFQIVISKTPETTYDICEMHAPHVVIMEVTRYSPWMIDERIGLSARIKKKNAGCKIIFMADGDAEKTLADQIVGAKRDGYADSILFTSVSEKFLASEIVSLEPPE